MHLIQILLPLYDNARQPFPPDEYLHVRNELTHPLVDGILNAELGQTRFFVCFVGLVFIVLDFL